MELVTGIWATNNKCTFDVLRDCGDIPVSPLDRARERFGGNFAHEPKTRWKQNATPVLTRWMAKENWSNQV